MRELPPTIGRKLPKLFWDVDRAGVDLELHEGFVLGRLLNEGDREVVQALRQTVGDDALAAFVRRAGCRLDRRTRRSLEVVLEIAPGPCTTTSSNQAQRAALSALKPAAERGFYLAGGTGPCLHLAHRRSIDLDLFRTESFDAADVGDAHRRHRGRGASLARRVLEEAAPRVARPPPPWSGAGQCRPRDSGLAGGVDVGRHGAGGGRGCGLAEGATATAPASPFIEATSADGTGAVAADADADAEAPITSASGGRPGGASG
jgi:hypothetical protein